jgi:hypothetical protein
MSKTADNSNLSVKPNIAYDFTNNVTGRVEYTGSRTTEMGGAITTSNIFGVVAEINFRRSWLLQNVNFFRMESLDPCNRGGYSIIQGVAGVNNIL